MISPDPVSAPDLVLEAPGLTPLQRIRRLTAESYRRRISVYCQIFGRRREDGSVRPLDRKTVERWIRAGREVEGGPDLPPLDAPELMAEWFRRIYGRKVPEVLLAFEDSGKGGGAAEVEAAPAPVADSPADGEAALEAFRRAVARADADSVGIEASLERARVAERLAFHQWQVVLERPEKYPESAISKRKKAWEDAANVLLKAEEKAEKILAQSDEWGRWSELEAVVCERVGYVGRGVRSLFTRAATKVSLPPDLFANLNNAYQAEIDRFFALMAAGDFREMLELEG